MPENAEENEEFLKLVHSVLLEVNVKSILYIAAKSLNIIYEIDSRSTRSNGLSQL